MRATQPDPGSLPFTADRAVYGTDPVHALTAAEAADLDRRARDAHGVPDGVLMESAGRAAAQLIDRLYPRGRVVAAVGAGNNGGDALVAVRALRTWGRDVAWVAASAKRPDAALLHGHDLPELEAAAAPGALAAASVLVDGILGTGAHGAAREPAAGWISRLNEAGPPVVALDLPSGVDPTTGGVPGAAVRAAATVTFGHPKLGLLLHPARARCGRIVAVEIGFPPFDAEPGAALITPRWVEARLPRRPPDAHKGTAGKVLLLVGREGVAGAAVICARGALRGGAGYTRVASVPANRVVLQGTLPDAIFVDRDDAAALAAAAADSDALIAGPGIGTDDAARRALEGALAGRPDGAVLLDADALTLFAGRLDELEAIAAARPLVLTPHPGEMGRLLGRSTGEIVDARLDAARELAASTGAVVLLKGQPSIVAARDRPLLLNTVGSSDLATAGMGDHLSGAVGALLGAGLDARDAAAAGLFLASRAADIACRGPALLSGDVAAAYPEAWARPGAAVSDLALPFVLFDQPPRW